MADKERQNIGAVQDEASVPSENTNGPKDCQTVTLTDNYHVDDEFTCSKEASKCTDSTPGVDELANTTSSLVRDAQEQVALNSSKPNGAPATVKKPTKKRKARGPLPATSSKRRSDRTNLHRKQVESLFQVSTSKLDDQEREIFELKLDKLEKILATEIPSAQYFTIAGRWRMKVTTQMPLFNDPLSRFFLRWKVIRASRTHFSSFSQAPGQKCRIM